VSLDPHSRHSPAARRLHQGPVVELSISHSVIQTIGAVTAKAGG
jgi:hypothetical protein